jgi:hypothetical protein
MPTSLEPSYLFISCQLRVEFCTGGCEDRA